MPEVKMQTAIGMCVVDLTKYLMNKYNLSRDVAFAMLQGNLCGRRPTSCGDQLAKALQKAK